MNDLSAQDRIGKPPDMALADAVTIEDVRAAASRIAGSAVRTPTLRSPTLEIMSGAARVWLKCENFQRINAFKFRGAFNAVSQMDPELGVLAYSSGNHAQAIALSASLLGRRAIVIMPSNAPAVKLERTRALLERAGEGSGVIEYDPATTTREELAAQFAMAGGLEIVPPYDDPRVIAGQGTAALELLEDADEPLDVLLVCCGGGGLASGCAVAAKALSPGVRVIAVEPANADDAKRSFDSGVLHSVSNPDTIADGARTPYLGRYTFPMITRHVDAIETVSEQAIADAAGLALLDLKMMVEPAGALALAGLLSRPAAFSGQRVGVVISGGNADPEALVRLMT